MASQPTHGNAALPACGNIKAPMQPVHTVEEHTADYVLEPDLFVACVPIHVQCAMTKTQAPLQSPNHVRIPFTNAQFYNLCSAWVRPKIKYDAGGADERGVTAEGSPDCHVWPKEGGKFSPKGPQSCRSEDAQRIRGCVGGGCRTAEKSRAPTRPPSFPCR